MVTLGTKRCTFDLQIGGLNMSRWMEENCYHAVNNEKTMFMKWKGSDYIMHGLFVDDMMHTSTSENMMVKFFKLYSKTFKYTCGDLMKTFLGS